MHGVRVQRPIVIVDRVGFDYGTSPVLHLNTRKTGKLNLNLTTVLTGLLLARGCVGVWKLMIATRDLRE